MVPSSAACTSAPSSLSDCQPRLRHRHRHRDRGGHGLLHHTGRFIQRIDDRITAAPIAALCS